MTSQIARRVAAAWVNESGGLADSKSPHDFNSVSIVNGLIVELEHVNRAAHEALKDIPQDVKRAVEIAMDHLVEDPDYYVKLSSMVDEQLLPED